jgi:hypothetical protein
MYVDYFLHVRCYYYGVLIHPTFFVHSLAFSLLGPVRHENSRRSDMLVHCVVRDKPHFGYRNILSEDITPT